jgi:adenosine deaminase
MNFALATGKGSFASLRLPPSALGQMSQNKVRNTILLDMPYKNILSTLLATAITMTTLAQTPADISAWPKIELHLHLDCSLSYAVVKKLDPSITRTDYQRDFIAPRRCTDLADYISRADRMVALMQTRENLRLATLDVFDQLKKEHVIYAELRFAPLKHQEKGLTPDEVVEAVDAAVDEGIRKTGVQAGLLLCTLRHFTKEQSMQTVKLVEKYRGGTHHVVGFDIAGDEAGYPIDNHIAAFQFAQAHGIPITAHAGEAAGPKSVWETLNNLHPTRIGHGVRSAEDPALLTYLKTHNILLEVCPTSNLQTNMYPDITAHPVNRLYKAGVPLGINTDCRTISNTNLDYEYVQLIHTFQWTKADFLRCNLAALDHAFTTDAIKARLRTQLLKAYSSATTAATIPATTTAAGKRSATAAYRPASNRTTK